MKAEQLAHDFVPKVNNRDAAACLAVYNGNATPEEQGVFIRWLLTDVCGINNDPHRSGKSDDSAYLSGRRFVGMYLVAVALKQARVKLEEGREDE